MMMNIMLHSIIRSYDWGNFRLEDKYLKSVTSFFVNSKKELLSQKRFFPISLDKSKRNLYTAKIKPLGWNRVK